MNRIPGDLYSSSNARPNVPGGCPFCGPDGEFTRQAVCPHLLAEYGPKGLVWHAANDTISALGEQAATWAVRRTRFPSPSWQELVGDRGIFEQIPEGRANYDNFAFGDDSFILGICRYVRRWDNPGFRYNDPSSGSSRYYFSDPDDRARIVAALRTLKRRLEAENARWFPNPRRYEAIRDSCQSRYAEAVTGAARHRQREIKTRWSYYCPFCSRVVDAGAICLQPCRHLVLFGVPGYLWLGPNKAEISRLASLVSDAFYDGASLSDLLREPFDYWRHFQMQDWANLEHAIAYHPLLLDLSRKNLREMECGGDIHFLLADDGVRGVFQSEVSRMLALLETREERHLRRIRMLETADDGRGLINVAPFAVENLSRAAARDFLLKALKHSERAAIGAVYTASMAVHGCPIGNGVAAQMSYGYLMRVRRVVKEQDAREILVQAGVHQSEAVRNCIIQFRKNWEEYAKNNTWPAHLPRWPES